MGLQRKMLEDVEKELGLGTSQLLAMFVKIMRKISMHFRQLQESSISETLPANSQQRSIDSAPEGEADANSKNPIIDPSSVGKALQAELAAGGAEFDAEERERARAMIDALPLDKYEMGNGDAAWEDAEKQIREAEKKGGAGNKTIAVKSEKKEKESKRKAGEALAEVQKEAEKYSGKKSKKMKR
jgi:N-acetyltransferase 10